MLMPVSGYEDLPLVSLGHAVAQAISLLPDIQKYADVAKQNCKEPAGGLTIDESAAIMLHTMNWKPIDKTLFSSIQWNSSIPCEESELPGDGAIQRKSPLDSTIEQTYAGALSFLRRNYTRNLTNVDVAVTDIALDLATTYRPDAQFGP
ncbi:unnamed protein product [Rotaria magnacalcarata]|uniref:Uncharacterized protein n=1 Tax=Rotaria magnacalcarata TaxID=392030 RepID=A0A819RF85_9BILA|nr:unnamed protein product [Rotaria magnacalcarata]